MAPDSSSGGFCFVGLHKLFIASLSFLHLRPVRTSSKFLPLYLSLASAYSKNQAVCEDPAVKISIDFGSHERESDWDKNLLLDCSATRALHQSPNTKPGGSSRIFKLPLNS